MHELSIARAVVTIAERHAGGRRVSRVELELGRLRQVSPGALAFGFEVASRGTAAEGAELVVDEIPVRLTCRRCGAATAADAFPLACTACGSPEVEIADGEQLHVVGLELEAA